MQRKSLNNKDKEEQNKNKTCCKQNEIFIWLKKQGLEKKVVTKNSQFRQVTKFQTGPA